MQVGDSKQLAVLSPLITCVEPADRSRPLAFKTGTKLNIQGYGIAISHAGNIIANAPGQFPGRRGACSGGKRRMIKNDKVLDEPDGFALSYGDGTHINMVVKRRSSSVAQFFGLMAIVLRSRLCRIRSVTMVLIAPGDPGRAPPGSL